MDEVRVALAVAPRLLSDCLTQLLTGPGLSWECAEGRSPDVCLATIDRLDQAIGDVIIVLPERAEDPVQLLIHGQVIPGPHTPPEQLRALVLGVATPTGQVAESGAGGGKTASRPPIR